MDKKLTVKDKILSFLETKGINKADFYAETGIEPSNFKGKNKDSLPGSAMLVKILTKYPELSADWLLTGEGEMVKKKQSPSAVMKHTTSPNQGIPLIPFSAMAGALTGELPALEYECERYVVPAFKGADFLMSVKGNSMVPTYLSGDIVACQRVPMTDIFFQWNKPYVLDTAQGALIKRLKPGSDNKHVQIVSDNREYDPFELSYEEINAVAMVIGLIRLE